MTTDDQVKPAMLSLLLTMLWRSRVRWQRSNLFDPELATFVQAVFLVLIIAGQFHSVMHMSYAKVLFFFPLGIVAREPAAAVQPAVVGRHSIEPALAPDWAGHQTGAVTTVAAGGDQ